jgi:hypothetical protein
VLLETVIYLTMLFLLCMVCHGELVRLKPDPRRLTSFYLTIAAGGALGGLLVAVVCPLVFATYLELNLALVGGFLLAAALLIVSVPRNWVRNTSFLMRGCLGCLLVIVVAIVLWGQWEAWDREQGIVNERNFYGVVSVKERYPEDLDLWGMALYHGDTLHGYQHLSEAKRDLPTAYYTPGSGVGRALRAAGQDGPIRVGIVGLGVGTLAAYGRPADVFRFYEIDPLVIRLAQQHFTFLKQCPAAWETIPGDARLSLEREADQQFDLLVLDAFSGDTIPVHLLTSEAFAIYLRHLKPEGAIAAHVSSRYVDLIPVVMAQARRFQLADVVIRTAGENPPSAAGADWMLLSRSPEFFDAEVIHEVAQVTAVTSELPLWTDQYSNLFGVLRRARSARH